MLRLFAVVFPCTHTHQGTETTVDREGRVSRWQVAVDSASAMASFIFSTTFDHRAGSTSVFVPSYSSVSADAGTPGRSRWKRRHYCGRERPPKPEGIWAVISRHKWGRSRPQKILPASGFGAGFYAVVPVFSLTSCPIAKVKSGT